MALEKEKADYMMSGSGCQGFCQMGPLVTLYPQGVLYTKVKAEDVSEIVEKTLLHGELVERLLFHSPDGNVPMADTKHIPFYAKQHRTVLRLCGLIDAQDIDEYIANGGYEMAQTAYLKMRGEEICDVILRSGLRGRGGGGFPMGRKWELTRVQNNDVKYVICNGDEGDPGAFMDSCVMEGDTPQRARRHDHRRLRAIGAHGGRTSTCATEYPLAVERLGIAIKVAARARAYSAITYIRFGQRL